MLYKVPKDAISVCTAKMHSLRQKNMLGVVVSLQPVGKAILSGCLSFLHEPGHQGMVHPGFA